MKLDSSSGKQQIAPLPVTPVVTQPPSPMTLSPVSTPQIDPSVTPVVIQSPSPMTLSSVPTPQINPPPVTPVVIQPPSLTMPPVPAPDVDSKSLAKVMLLLPGLQRDFEEEEENIIEWLKLAEEPRVREYLAKLLTQVKIGRRVLSTPERITEPHAKKLLTLWKCARRTDVADFFKLKQHLAMNEKNTPSFLPVENKPAPKKVKVAPPKITMNKLDSYLCVLDTGALVAYEDEKINKKLRAATLSPDLPDIELKIGEAEYTLSVKEMKQINKKTKFERPICEFKSWPSSRPAFWDSLPTPLLPVLQADMLKGRACEFGVLTFALQALQALGRTVIGVKFNKNKKLFAQYCLFRKSIENIDSKNTKEVIFWHGTSFANARKFVHGTKRDYTEHHLWGEGVYFAKEARYSLQRQYASPYTGDIDGKPVKNVQTLVPCFVTFGAVCQGTPDMKHLPKGYTASADNPKNPDILVTYDDAQAYPVARIFVAPK